MITLYGMRSPNVRKVFIALHELDLPYTFRFVDVQMGEQFTPEFERLNPARKVPVITDEDGPGGRPLTVFESGAILIYLAEKCGRLLPQEPAARATALQWLMFQMASVGPMLGQKAHFILYAPPGQDYPLARYSAEMERQCRVMETRLTESPWLAGDEYGLADIAVWPWLSLLQERSMGVDMAPLPRLCAWLDAVASRPAVKAAMAAAAKMPVRDIEQIRRHHPDRLDLFLGREPQQKAGTA